MLRRMISDLALDLELRDLPTVRDADGLALSSRNSRLSAAERERALALPRALATRDPERARELLDGPRGRLRRDRPVRPPVLAAAIHVGSTRLIDNVPSRGGLMSTRPRTPGHGAPGPGKLPITELLGMKESHSPIAMITAYDAPSGRLADAAGADMILVGDSAAMTMLGHDSTVPATMEEMLVLTRAVTRGAKRPLVVADMPFGSFQISDELAVTNAVRFVKDAGADAVKLEGAGTMLSRVHAIVGAGVPVMGHIGLTPQSATALGGFKAQGRTASKAAQLVRDALALEAAGCFAIVLEAVPSPVAAKITELLQIPTIGIGAGGSVDGQVLVWHDLLGLYDGHAPRFVKQYAQLATEIQRAVEEYVGDVRERRFPEEVHTYGMPEEELAAFEAELESSGIERRATRLRAGAKGCCRVTDSTANAATITAASASAPATPRHGSSKVVRRPSASSPSDQSANASPIARTTAGRCRRPSRRSGTSRSRTPTTITGTVTRIESANGSAAKPTSCRAVRPGPRRRLRGPRARRRRRAGSSRRRRRTARR